MRNNQYLRGKCMKVLVAINPFLTNVDCYKGYEFVINPWGGDPTSELIANELSKEPYDALLVGTKRIGREIAEECPTLKIISRVGAGYENNDVEFFRSRNIITTNTPYAPTKSTAEHAVTLLLAGNRNLVEYNNNLKNKIWTRTIRKSLGESAVGIVGTGNIGRQTARLLKGFGCKIYLYDRLQDHDFAKEVNGTFITKEEIISKCDIISLHLPATEETASWISAKELSVIGEKPCIIVNNARGNLVDENSLIGHLRKHENTIYCADVFKEEPYYGELCELKNTILTPHISTSTFSARIEAERQAIENAIAVLEGKPCKYVL